ncbi:MAG: TIGR02186 family protein [Alphaproteobacteria bacterium]
MRWRRGAAVLIVTLAAALPAWGAPLVADLSSHLIAIDSGFTGADVLLYGAIDEKGDLLIVVRGPEERVVVRRKDRVAGIWMNRDKIEFDDVPAFYAIATNRPLDEVASPELLSLYQIGLESLGVTARDDRPPEEIASFREALFRNRIRNGLYAAEPGKVDFLGERLFRTKIVFPANVPTGTYQAQVFLIRDGAVVSAETTPLFISKSGFEAEINFFAHTRPALYGLAAIVTALIAGWIAAVVFRKT